MDKNRLFIYLNPCIMFSMATDLPEENRMKALTLLDEMSQFHWSMLKSVLLILSMLPVAQGVLSVWQSTDCKETHHNLAAAFSRLPHT